MVSAAVASADTAAGAGPDAGAPPATAVSASVSGRVTPAPLYQYIGFPVSGLPPGGLEIVHATGPAWLTGAAFGPEGGLLGLGALLFCAAGIWAWTRWHSSQTKLKPR